MPVQFRKSPTPVVLFFYCPVQNEEFISVEQHKNVYLVHIVNMCNAVYCYQSSKYVGVWWTLVQVLECVELTVFKFVRIQTPVDFLTSSVWEGVDGGYRTVFELGLHIYLSPQFSG